MNKRRWSGTLRAWAALCVWLSCSAFARLAIAQSMSRPTQHPADRALLAQRDRFRTAMYATLLDQSDDANVALLRGVLDGTDAVAAQRDIDRVIARAPNFAAGYRVRCSLHLEAGRVNDARADCARAVSLDRNDASNLIAIARVHLTEQGRGAARDLSAARDAVREGLSLYPDHLQGLALQCEIAFAMLQSMPKSSQDNTGLEDLGRCSRGLDRAAPGSTVALFFGVFAALSNNEDSRASERIDALERSGFTPAEISSLRSMVDARTPWPVRWWRRLWPALAAWAMTGALLFAIAAALSAVTMGATRRVGIDDQPSDSERRLRSIYRTIITLCSVYYYASIPFVALLVLGLAAGMLALILFVGRVPIKLVAIVAIVVCVTLYAMAKSLFVRAKDAEPGEKLDLDAHPKLAAVIADAAAETRTRPVDVVYLVPDAAVAVFEQGSVLDQWRGRARRCLLLGVGVLEGITVGELRAVLAHEYGHFRNEDTAGGFLALAVRRSMFAFASEMGRQGVATWYNPAWWFVSGFYRLFLRASQGASRLQEVLADRVAAKAYGSENFARGLQRVIEQSVRFDAYADASLNEALSEQIPMTNLYAYRPSTPVDDAAIEQQVTEEINREASAYDSHPPPSERIAKVLALAFAARAVDGDDQSAWALFEARSAIEQRMTDVVRDNVLAQTGRTLLRYPSEVPLATTPAAAGTEHG